MKQKAFRIISTVTFWAGIALSAFSLYTLIPYITGAPAAASAYIDGRPFMIAAIALLVISFVTSFFTGKKSKEESQSTKHKEG